MRSNFALLYPSRSSDSDVTGGNSGAARLLLVVLGVMPVTLIALSTFGFGLRGLAVHVALPAVVILALVCARRRPTSTLVRSALVIGMAATALYDASRLACMWVGLVDRDPIPHIGTALGLNPPVVFGYLWRYAGNGTGLALAFLALGLEGVIAGVAYGLVVCAGLLLTLAVSPHGQEMLVPLRTGAVLMLVTGHAIYGAVVGCMSQRRPAFAEPSSPSPTSAVRSAPPQGTRRSRRVAGGARNGSPARTGSRASRGGGAAPRSRRPRRSRAGPDRGRATGAPR